MPTAQAIYDAVDAGDILALAGFLADDATMVFGNGEPLVGRPTIIAANEAFFTTIKAVQHKILNEWTIGTTTTIVEVEVTYTRLDDQVVTIPGVTIWHVSDGLITDLRVFYDPTPVFAP